MENWKVDLPARKNGDLIPPARSSFQVGRERAKKKERNLGIPEKRGRVKAERVLFSQFISVKLGPKWAQTMQFLFMSQIVFF